MVISNRVLTAALLLFNEHLRESAMPGKNNFAEIEAVQSMVFETSVMLNRLAGKSDTLCIKDVKVLLPGEKSPSN